MAAAGETVLIVEDEPAMREVTRRILSRSGDNVIAAASGHEAIEIASRRADPALRPGVTASVRAPAGRP